MDLVCYEWVYVENGDGMNGDLVGGLRWEKAKGFCGVNWNKISEWEWLMEGSLSLRLMKWWG